MNQWINFPVRSNFFKRNAQVLAGLSRREIQHAPQSYFDRERVEVSQIWVQAAFCRIVEKFSVRGFLFSGKMQSFNAIRVAPAGTSTVPQVLKMNLMDNRAAGNNPKRIILVRNIVCFTQCIL